MPYGKAFARAEWSTRGRTVEDLLTMRLGFGFAFEVKSCPVGELAGARGLGMGPPLPSAVRHTPDEWIEQFATLPLMDQPGRYWRYDLAYSVLGVLLARAAGIPLPRLMSERLFQPLGMSDTGFVVPDHARARLIPCFTSDGEGGLAVFDDTDDSDWLAQPSFPHAGGGLVSTATDYLRFGRLLLDGGGSLLTKEAIADLSTDHLTQEQRNGPSAGIFLDGEGWGPRRTGPTRPGPAASLRLGRRAGHDLVQLPRPRRDRGTDDSARAPARRAGPALLAHARRAARGRLTTLR